MFEHHLSRLERKGRVLREGIASCGWNLTQNSLSLLVRAGSEQTVPCQFCLPSCRCSQPCCRVPLPRERRPRPQADERSHCKCCGLQKMAALTHLENTQLRTGKLIFSLQKISHGETFSCWMRPLVYREFLT